MPKLIAGDGRQLVVEGSEVTVGRRESGTSPDLDLGEFERGRTVSRRHARLFQQRAQWHLRVEASARNDTRVGGRVLHPGDVAPLNDGDEIQLGAVSLTFRLDPDPDKTIVAGAQAAAELQVDGFPPFPLSAHEDRRLWIGRRALDGGRTPDIDLRDVPGSRSVSHLHAQVFRTPSGWMLHEGRTTNPTLVNGRQLSPGENVPLTNGVPMQLGRLRMIFREVRPVRVLTSDILIVEVESTDITIEPGQQLAVGIRLVNATGRVEQVEVALDGLPAEWYEVRQTDGTRGRTWRLQLVPAGSDLVNPVPNSFALATLMLAPPRVAASRAGLYPVTVEATTQGEDRVRRVVPGKVRVLPFEGLEVSLSPNLARAGSAKYALDVTNTGNADANVEFVFEGDAGIECTADPPRLTLTNGSTQRSTIKVRVKRRAWWGPVRTFGYHVEAVAGTQRAVSRATLICKPIIPVWLQEVVTKLFAILSPIAIPAATLLVVLGLAYLVLRPPDIARFAADPPEVAAGTAASLVWRVDRAAALSIEPPLDQRVEGAEASPISVTPDATTVYTLTARNWIGISSSAKATLNVVKIVDFHGTPPELSRENTDLTLHWETQGAVSVKIEPSDGISDPKVPTDDKVVRPTGPTPYTLIATGPGGVQVKRVWSVRVGAPTLKKLEVIAPPEGTRIFPGDVVTLSWIGDGFSQATLTSNNGDAALDVSTGPPAKVRPMTPGDVEYTLNVANAADSATLKTIVHVNRFEITRFDADQDTIERGKTTTLHWDIAGANDTTQITIEPNVGRVTGKDRVVSPLETTVYTLKAKFADGTELSQPTSITVEPPPPTVSLFKPSRSSVTLGETVLLNWKVDDAVSVDIRTGDREQVAHVTDSAVTGAQHLPLTTPKTIYILEATGPSGKTKTETTEVEVKLPQPATPVPAPAAQPAVAAPSPSPGRP
jgi:pSer/pThr/pTyr-binding forkhead associated (FHA) protein